MQPVLRVANLRREFGGLVAVKDVSFEIFEGEFVGLIGPNGCGKSTTFNCISGLLEQTTGKIEIYGKDNCPFCDRALHKAQAMMQETSEHEYSYWKLGKDFTREDLFEKFPNARTFPQITVDGELVGGWTEFEKI